jgi:VWFA-related protein
MLKRAAGAVAVLSLIAALRSAPVQAGPRQIPWPQLPQRVAGHLIPAADLGVKDCPRDLASRVPSRRVLQYIENVFYSWEEFDLVPAPGEAFCVVMRRPLNRPLSAAEAQVLLTASSLWLETANAQPRGLAMPDGLVRGRAPLPWHGDLEPVLSPDPAPDRGIVGSPAKAGTGPAEREGKPAPAPPGTLLGNLKDVIGGKDDRAVVANTGTFPNRVISYVAFDTESQSGTPLSGRATGFLVSPYMLLTNGHVVWNEDRREMVSNLTIAPGFNGATGPFGTRSAVRLATNPGWVATAKIQYDYAAAFIDTPFDGITTFMPLAFDVSPAGGSQVRVAGYPAKVRGADTAAQWSAADRVVSVQGRVLRYKVDTSPGNSGSPVWQVLAGGQVRTIGIHSTGDPTNSGNSGVRLVSQNFDLISEWLSWTPQTNNGLHLTINQIDAGSCPLVKAIATVNDDAGQPVPDLTRANFTLAENGVPQAIDVEQAEVSDNAISVALVLDASSSLSDSDVDNIRDASRRFVDLLGPRDKVAVYHFANGVALVQDYTSDKTRAKAAINALTNDGGAVGDGGGTALFDALVEAARHSTQTTGRRALVVMTDGMNNTGSETEGSAIAAANAAAVPVFTIGFGDADTSVLGDVAAGTGGRFFPGGSSADLQSILAAIGRTFAKQYLLSWVTSFVSGGNQSVDVTVTDGFDSDEGFSSYSQSGASGCAPPDASCVVHVVHPNGGEVWTKGKPQTIQWTTSGPSCGSTDGLALSDGSQIWYLADTAARSQTLNIDFLPTGTLYRAIVADRATGHFDTSDDTFTIAAPSAGFTCAKGTETLCLLKGRYQVKALWHATDGSGGGFARAVPVGDAGGYFWFFDNTNPELVLKLVDGRAVNAHVWFFSGALTSFEYSIFVTDAKTGETRVYSSVEGEFRSFADDTAFGPPPEGDGTAAVHGPARAGGAEPVAPLAAWPGRKTGFAALAASQAVLWEQSDHVGTVVIASTNRTDAPQYSTETADDFVVPAQKTWLLQGVDVAGAYYGSGAHGPADSVNVVVYADRNGFPGAASCTFRQVRPRSGLDSGVFEVDLTGICRLPAGRYWVEVQTNQDTSATGVWGWVERTALREKPSAWRNPGGGFNTACNDWGRRAATCKIGDQPDLIFRLRGQETTGGGGGGGSCSGSATALCLSNKRIKAEVTWRNPKGQLVAAHATALTGSTGYFSLDSTGVDLAVKIIDGRPVNGSFWLFYGGLSSVEYTLRITDPVTGTVKTYANPKGRYASGGDAGAVPSP